LVFFDNERKREDLNLKNPIFLINTFFKYTLKGQFISIFENEINFNEINSNFNESLRESISITNNDSKKTKKKNSNKKPAAKKLMDINDINEIDKICEEIEGKIHIINTYKLFK